jgi:hypothetical protein
LILLNTIFIEYFGRNSREKEREREKEKRERKEREKKSVFQGLP